MDQASAAVVAAIISAAVVAGTFVAAEIIKSAQAARRARIEVVLALVEALEVIPVHADSVLSTRWPFRPRVQAPDLEIGKAGVRLYAYLPRRDWLIVKWLGWRLAALSVADFEGRIRVGADLSAVFVGYIADRRRALRYVSQWRAEILQWFADGQD